MPNRVRPLDFTMARTSISPAETMDAALTYITAVFDAFRHEPAKRKEIVKLLEDIRFHRVDVPTGCARLMELLIDHRTLLLGLKDFLPAHVKLDLPALTVDDSRSYIAAVKEAFKDEPENYDEFLQILNYAYTHREDEALCYARVKELMKDYPILLFGFKVFLPAHSKITIPPVANKGPKLTVDDSNAYMAAVKEAFKDEPRKFQEFLQIMMYLCTRRIDLATGLAFVKELMKDHPILLLGFNVYLRPESKIPIPPVANKGDDAFSYITAVKEAFHLEPARYSEFLRLLSDYRANGLDVISLIVRVDEFLKDYRKLLPGFVAFLPDETEQPTHSGFVKKIKEVFQDGPAKYKEFKKLLNDFRARSVKQKHPRAHNLVAKVKERFQGDDIHVYKSFLQIVRMLREGNLFRDKVYHEIVTLLQDHQDLVMDFSDFFNKPPTSTTSAS